MILLFNLRRRFSWFALLNSILKFLIGVHNFFKLAVLFLDWMVVLAYDFTTLLASYLSEDLLKQDLILILKYVLVFFDWRLVVLRRLLEVGWSEFVILFAVGVNWKYLPLGSLLFFWEIDFRFALEFLIQANPIYEFLLNLALPFKKFVILAVLDFLVHLLIGFELIEVNNFFFNLDLFHIEFQKFFIDFKLVKRILLLSNSLLPDLFG